MEDKKLAAVIKYYENNITLVIPSTAPTLMEISEKFSNELVFKAIDIACKRNKRNLSYIEGILTSWERKGYKCLADIQEEKQNSSTDTNWNGIIDKLFEEEETDE